MNKKIILQKCHFNNIYLILYILIFFINLLIQYNIDPDYSYLNANSSSDSSSDSGAGTETISDTEPDINYFQSKIINYFLTFNLADILAIIPYFIRKKLINRRAEKIQTVKTEDKDDKLKDNEPLIYIDTKINIADEKLKTIMKRLILLGICDFLKNFIMVLYSKIYPDKDVTDLYSFSCVVPFEIVLQFVCSYFILKIHFYKLQYFSLFLNLGLFIIILIIDIFNVITEESFDGKVFYFLFLNIIIYSIEYSLGKRILLNGFISIYLLILIKGCISFILSLLFTLIVYLVDKESFSNFGNFFTEPKYIGLIIINIFCYCFVSIFLWLIIDRFSPNYLPFVLIFEEVSYYILDKIYNYDNRYITMKWDEYVRISLYVISIIGVMLHNEMVVINICNLGSDTKYFLDIKFENEELFAHTDNPDIIKRYESIEMDSRSSNDDNLLVDG